MSRWKKAVPHICLMCMLKDTWWSKVTLRWLAVKRSFLVYLVICVMCLYTVYQYKWISSVQLLKCMQSFLVLLPLRSIYNIKMLQSQHKTLLNSMSFYVWEKTPRSTFLLMPTVYCSQCRKIMRTPVLNTALRSSRTSTETNSKSLLKLFR